MDRTGRLLVFLLLVWAAVAVRISQAQSNFDVRIGAGTDPGNAKRGIVEVFYNSQWGSICSTGWSFENAAVACRNAVPAIAWVKYKSWDIDEGNVTSTVWLDDLQCTGSEDNFDNCTSNNKWTPQTCTGRAAAVECQNFAITSGDLNAFLFGGLGDYTSAVDGNAFLREGNNGQFFYICGVGWSLTDADVFCRQGGHYGASTVYVESYFGVHPALLATIDVFTLPVNFQCSGTESSLMECPSQSVNRDERCYDGNNAGAVCLFREEPADFMVRLVGCPDPAGQGNAGRVQVKYNGTWGSVGAPFNPRTKAYGDVICRMINMGYAEEVTTSRDDCGNKEDLEPVIVDTVECTGAETSIAQCGRYLEFVFDENKNMSRDDTVVVCSGEVPAKEKPIKLDEVKVTAKFAALGFLSLYEKGKWFTVCNDEWTLENAQVVCRELKYGSPLKNFELTYESGTMGPMFRRYVRCRGDEESLAKCDDRSKVMQRQECSHNQDVYIGCTHSTEPYTVRLNPNKPSSYGRGPVEIFYEGMWGSICTDNWDVKDAFVACRQLGFNWVDDRGWEHNTATLDDFKWLNNMACTGRETALKDCQNDGHNNQLFRHPCTTTASVECSSISGYNEATAFIEGGFGDDTVTAEGLAYLQISAAEQVAICDHSWTKANADVFCRQIGKLSAQRAVSGSYYGRHRPKNGIFPVRKWNVEFQCDGNEASLVECVTFARPDGDCPDGRDAGVVCLSQDAPEDFQIRLQGGKDNKEGRVEVFYNDTWGSLGKNNHLENPYNFGDVVCRELKQGYAIDVPLDGSYGGGEDLIKMDNIWCAGSEDSLAQCGPFIDWMDSTDASLQDTNTGVICSGPLANNRNPVRLSEPANQRGYVEIFYKGRFGTVCNKGWTLANAQVVCLELGLGPPSEASFGLKGYGGPIYLQDVNCTGTESSLDQCPHGDWMVHSCDHSMDVSIMCEDYEPEMSTPKETTPKETTPKETTPKETTPKETTPKDSTPEDSTPGNVGSAGSHLTTPIILSTILYIVQAALHNYMF